MERTCSLRSAAGRALAFSLLLLGCGDERAAREATAAFEESAPAPVEAAPVEAAPPAQVNTDLGDTFRYEISEHDVESARARWETSASKSAASPASATLRRPPSNAEASAVLDELALRSDVSAAHFSALGSRLAALASIPSGSETDEDLGPLADALAATGLTSQVQFKTSVPGARIRYRLITWAEPIDATEPTNSNETLRIGYYYVWSERGGRPTSDPRRRFRIVREELPLDLEETQ